MSLRIQLLLVSLLTLALPWAGAQYVREMEQAQRRGYEDALAGSAAIVASALRGRTDLLYHHPDALDATAEPERELFAAALDRAATLDGYGDDWSPDFPATAATGTSDDSLQVKYRAGVAERNLFLLIEVRDDSVEYADPVLLDQVPRDEVLLALSGPGGKVQHYSIATQAPGPLVAHHRGEDETVAARIQAAWQSTANGYNVELRIPLDSIGPRLGFAIADADRGIYTGTAGTLPLTISASRPPVISSEPGVLIYAPPVLRGALQEFAQAGKRLAILDRAGWLLAQTGTLAADPATDNNIPAGPLARLYRFLLDPDALPLAAEAARPGLLSGPGVAAALGGEAATGWYRQRGGQRAIVAATQPIRSGNRIIGAVVLEQTSDAILTLTNHALTRLMNLTLLASVLAAVGLLGFATLLSFRIRRLRNAAERALGPDGAIAAGMPGARARDELGDLSRSFSSLLLQLREYTEYLQALASRLSHELRTPLAVVRSSLENLEQQDLPESARVYSARASEGTARLGAILTAMSEATRVEASIQGAEAERFDLRALLDDMVRAYRDVYPQRQFTLRVPDDSCPVNGVPDLIVQMLDKLVDNAVDFSGEGARIALSLNSDSQRCILIVANEGPLLPERMQTRLFDSLVSVREQRGNAAHLGLGLFIVRLIVEFHRGTVQARNADTGDGVEFVITLPAARTPG